MPWLSVVQTGVRVTASGTSLTLTQGSVALAGSRRSSWALGATGAGVMTGSGGTATAEAAPQRAMAPTMTERSMAMEMVTGGSMGGKEQGK